MSNFIDNKRCPVCLMLGQFRYQFGNYVCTKCDRTFSTSTLQHHHEAFEAGRKWEMEHSTMYRAQSDTSLVELRRMVATLRGSLTRALETGQPVDGAQVLNETSEAAQKFRCYHEDL